MLPYWQLNPDFQLCWKNWDDQLVLYHTGSGDTHLIDFMGYEILQYLQEQPRTVEDIQAYILKTESAVEVDEESVNIRLNEFLAEMFRLGIAEQVNV